MEPTSLRGFFNQLWRDVIYARSFAFFELAMSLHLLKCGGGGGGEVNCLTFADNICGMNLHITYENRVPRYSLIYDTGG